jgi:6,7-dimethyl-8-ribityllumazine synthase
MTKDRHKYIVSMVFEGINKMITKDKNSVCSDILGTTTIHDRINKRAIWFDKMNQKVYIE